MNSERATLLLVENDDLVMARHESMLISRGFCVQKAVTFEDMRHVVAYSSVDMALIDTKSREGFDIEDAVRLVGEDFGIPIVFILNGIGPSPLAKLEPFASGYVEAYAEEGVFIASVHAALRLNKSLRSLKEGKDVLAANSAKYEEVFLTTPSPAAISRASDGLIIDVNPAFAEYLGYTREELIGKTSTDIGIWVDSLGRQRFLDLLNDKGKVEGYEIRSKRKDGENVVSLFFSVMFKVRGESYVFNIVTGITSLRNTEEKLRENTRELERLLKKLHESENDYRTLVDAIVQPIFTLNAEGRYLMMNLEGARQLGGKPSDFVGRLMSDFFPPEFAEPQLAAIKQVTSTKETWQEYRYSLVNGEQRFYHAVIRPIPDADGGCDRGLVVLTDLSELKTREKELQESRESLSSALEENKALFGELQHRVKNSFILISSLINFELQRISDPVLRKTMEDIASRVRTLGNLFTTLAETGNVRRVRLDRYLQAISTSIQSSYIPSTGRIHMETHFREMEISAKNASAVGLVLNEFVTNALKYAFSDGRSGTVRIELGIEGEFAFLEVADDGVGLPSSFSVMEQKGTGLKLVQLLAEQLAGRVSSSARESGGAAFRLVFPLKEEG
jgi:PAS domain S-box-containing protein